MIRFESKGSFKNTDKFLSRMSKRAIFKSLNAYGQKGVAALASATPKASGVTANSWYYEIDRDGKNYSIVWKNSNSNDGAIIAILLQYGHGTGTGGYVAGRDFINPAIRPIFDQIAEDVWKEVTS